MARPKGSKNIDWTVAGPKAEKMSENMSIAEISKKLKVNAKGIYNYFRDNDIPVPTKRK